MIDPVHITFRDLRRLPPVVARVVVEVVCCPHCTSLDVVKRDWRAGAATVTWQCRGCGVRWREPATTCAANLRAAVP